MMMGKKKMEWSRAGYQMVGGIIQRKGGYEGRGVIWDLESEFSFFNMGIPTAIFICLSHLWVIC